MSLLLSPLSLFLLGALIARIGKTRRVWRRHSLFTPRTSATVLILYTALELSMLLDLAWTHPFTAGLPATDGTDWTIRSGLLHLDGSWPIGDPLVLAFVVLSFMAFPLWMYLGVMTSYWLFGRSPKQTGIVGLLR